jgi:antitoxin HigA-1
MKRLKPASPGQILLEELIQPLGLTQYQVAKACGIPHSTMTRIIKGQRPISVETALRLGRYFGIDAQFWLKLQTDYDLRQAGDKLQLIESQIQPLKRAA